MALEALSTSDWHLGGMYKPLGGRAAELQFNEIHKVYHYGLEHGVPRIFVPGDISDSPTLDEENMIRLVTLLVTYDDEIETHYMRGNHDVKSKFKTSLDLLAVLADAGVFKRFKLHTKANTSMIDGVNVSFLPWPSFEAPKADNGKGRLIFAHIEAIGAIGDNGRPLKAGNEEKVIRTADDYIVSGHIHQYQELKKKRMMYVGTLYQKNFGESLPKGFIHFKAGYKKGESKLQFKHDFINSRPNFVLESKVIKGPEDFADLKADPNIRYKLFVDRNAGVIIPKHLTQKFPNIVHISGVNTKGMSMEEVLEATRGESVTAGDLPQINPMMGLKPFLRKEGLDKGSMKKARSYVQEAMRHVSAVNAKNRAAA